jgi:hypothetical protein
VLIAKHQVFQMETNILTCCSLFEGKGLLRLRLNVKLKL